MKTEKVAARVEPKDAQALRRIARKQGCETLSVWLRALLKTEIDRHRMEAK